VTWTAGADCESVALTGFVFESEAAQWARNGPAAAVAFGIGVDEIGSGTLGFNDVTHGTVQTLDDDLTVVQVILP
jgi:hypothetical protein